MLGLKLLYHLLDRVSTPEVTAGAAGALVHLGQSTKLHLQKFVQLGGSKLLTRVAQDCSSNGALLQLLKLIYLMAVDTELKHVLTEDGLLRVALALLGKKPALPEAMLEICSGAGAQFACFAGTKVQILTQDWLRSRCRCEGQACALAHAQDGCAPGAACYVC